MAKIRVERVEQIVKKEVSLILQNEVKDPRLSNVIITDAKVTSDFSFATLFVTFMQSEHTNEEIFDSLERAKGFIRSKLSSFLKIKKVPQLIFKYDDSLEVGNRIDEVLKDLSN
ncbi:MAG: 30S ribosome-binding factor RbfA [Erysipelothrix sp.]|jgi:ribosome-binding factor A|nr:30S ribosome-binding factor RbfA [Erysipelothrix sp.]